EGGWLTAGGRRRRGRRLRAGAGVGVGVVGPVRVRSAGRRVAALEDGVVGGGGVDGGRSRGGIEQGVPTVTIEVGLPGGRGRGRAGKNPGGAVVLGATHDVDGVGRGARVELDRVQVGVAVAPTRPQVGGVPDAAVIAGLAGVRACERG